MVPSITKLVTEPEINWINAGDKTQNCLRDYLILAVFVFRPIIFKPIILNVIVTPDLCSARFMLHYDPEVG